MLLIEPGTELAGLCCTVCHAPVRAGDSVLLAFRRGKPSIVHAHVCHAPQRPSQGPPTGAAPRLPG